MTLLSLRNLAVRFRTPGGVVDAVAGIDLDVQPGEILGLVGESGSGKSVTCLAAMGLLESNAETSGDLRFEGSPITPARRGRAIGMIFQEPAPRSTRSAPSAASSVKSCRCTAPSSTAVPAPPRPPACCAGSACRRRNASSPPIRTRFPAAWRNASPSPWRSRAAPGCCSPTSPPPRSTSPCRRRFWSCWSACPTKPAWPSSWSPMISALSPSMPIASWSCVMARSSSARPCAPCSPPPPTLAQANSSPPCPPPRRPPQRRRQLPSRCCAPPTSPAISPSAAPGSANRRRCARWTACHFTSMPARPLPWWARAAAASPPSP